MDRLDILNRERFVDQLLSLVNNISAKKSSTCFAINGPWGCGKTFVLDLFQERLEKIQSEITFNDKFFVIRYNCWKFDYYEEPLIAIVSSMIVIIEEKTKLFPDGQTKNKILGMLKAVGISLMSVGADAIKEKIGFDAQKAFDIIQKGQIDGNETYEENHKYDVYFNFNKVLNELSNILQGLARDYTVIILVDELDRCLPEYAVKVLERLHHLVEDQSNIITIISIDKNQLMSSIKQIFGFNNPEKYLEKFINFEVKLDHGEITETIIEKYRDYFELFEKDIFPFKESVEECLQAIFKNIDIRSQEQLVNKAMLVHKLLYSDKKDYSFMCMEMLLGVMICVYHDQSCFSNTAINSLEFDKMFVLERNGMQPEFSGFFEKKFGELNILKSTRFSEKKFGELSILKPTIFSGENNYVLPKESSLYGAILFTWCRMHKKSHGITVLYKCDSKYEIISNNYKELEKYVEMIKMMS